MNYEKFKGHTPGPWEPGANVVWQRRGNIVAELTDTIQHRTFDEICANSYLIAAAPDLLTRCRELEAVLREALLMLDAFSLCDQRDYAGKKCDECEEKEEGCLQMRGKALVTKAEKLLEGK